MAARKHRRSEEFSVVCNDNWIRDGSWFLSTTQISFKIVAPAENYCINEVLLQYNNGA